MRQTLVVERVGCHLGRGSKREREREKAFSKPELYEARNDEGNLNAML